MQEVISWIMFQNPAAEHQMLLLPESPAAPRAYGQYTKPTLQASCRSSSSPPHSGSHLKPSSLFAVERCSYRSSVTRERLLQEVRLNLPDLSTQFENLFLQSHQFLNLPKKFREGDQSHQVYQVT